MKFAMLLPLQKGESVSSFSQRWLREITPQITKIIDPENALEMRKRNEVISSYLPVFVILISCYENKISEETRSYVASHGEPEKGESTTWKRNLELHLADLTTTRNMLGDYMKAVSSRLSASQTTLKSKSLEYASCL